MQCFYLNLCVPQSQREWRNKKEETKITHERKSESPLPSRPFVRAVPKSLDYNLAELVAKTKFGVVNLYCVGIANQKGVVGDRVSHHDI
jgi:hypothetical protein